MAISDLHYGDIICLVLYFLVLFGVGVWATLRKDKGTTSGYFLAGKSMTWIPIGASVFASNVGAPMFIGLAGSAAAGGIAVTTFEWHAVYMILLLAWFFLPVYISSGCMTMPEYMSRRFPSTSNRLRILLAVVTLLGYAVKDLVGQMYAGALFIKIILDWNVYWSCLVLLIMTGVYTILGGLAAVMWTDAVQSFIIIGGSAVTTVLCLIKVGGYEMMLHKYMAAAADGVFEHQARFGNVTCGIPRDDSFHLWRNAETGDLPWPGMVFGLTSIAMWVWCNDQVMVQRALAAKNIYHAKGGAVLASFLKLVCYPLFVIPGLAARSLYAETIACATPESCKAACGSERGCSNFAYPYLMLNILPPGVMGLLLAALMSALISSLTSILNSASSIFTLDLYTRCRTKASQAEMMIVGRVFTALIAAVAMAWLPVLESSTESQLWNYLQAITSYLVPPCSMCFLLAVLWTRMTEQAAFWGLGSGMVIGIIRMVIDFAFPAPICGSGEEDTRPALLKDLHFLHFAIVLSILTLIIMVVISLLTQPLPAEKIRRLTWWTHDDPRPLLLEEQNEGISIEEDEEKTTSNDKAGEKFSEEPENWVRRLQRGLLFCCCGIGETAEGQSTKQVEAQFEVEAKHSAVKTVIVNTAAILCLTMVTFLFGFFG